MIDNNYIPLTKYQLMQLDLEGDTIEFQDDLTTFIARYQRMISDIRYLRQIIKESRSLLQDLLPSVDDVVYDMQFQRTQQLLKQMAEVLD